MPHFFSAVSGQNFRTELILTQKLEIYISVLEFRQKKKFWAGIYKL